jgi:exopolysaccharide biosynthesis protein
LLDREGKIKVNPSSQQATRTVIAKTKQDEILLMITEGAYFTLRDFGELLKESNGRTDKGFNINTAMNLDGGISTSMILNTPKMNYVNKSWSRIPGTIGVFPRD